MISRVSSNPSNDSFIPHFAFFLLQTLHISTETSIWVWAKVKFPQPCVGLPCSTPLNQKVKEICWHQALCKAHRGWWVLLITLRTLDPALWHWWLSALRRDLCPVGERGSCWEAPSIFSPTVGFFVLTDMFWVGQIKLMQHSSLYIWRRITYRLSHSVCKDVLAWICTRMQIVLGMVWICLDHLCQGREAAKSSCSKMLIGRILFLRDFC